MDSATSLATPAELSTFNTGSGTRAYVPGAARPSGTGKTRPPVALTTSDREGGSPAARAWSPAPLQLPLRRPASPPPRALSGALTLVSAPQAGALGRRT